LHTSKNKRFTYFAIFEALSKFSLFFFIPITVFHNFDFEIFSYLYNFIQVGLPALSLGMVVLIYLDTKFKEKIVLINLALGFLFTVICSFIFFQYFYYILLIFLFFTFYIYGQFYTANFEPKELFFFQYFPKSLFILLFFALPFFSDISLVSIICLLGIYSIFLHILFWRKNFSALKNNIVTEGFFSKNLNKYIPILISTLIGLGYLVMPKLSASNDEIFEVITYLQIYQAVFIFLGIVLVKANTKQIYNSEDLISILLYKNYIKFYLFLFFVITLIKILFFYVFFFDLLANYYQIFLMYMSLVFFYFLYIVSYDYCIAKGYGTRAVSLFIMTLLISYVLFEAFDHKIEFALISVALNIVYFIGIFLIASGFKLKRLITHFATFTFFIGFFLILGDLIK